MGAFIRRLLSQLLDVKSLVIAFYFGTQTRSISSDKSES